MIAGIAAERLEGGEPVHVDDAIGWRTLAAELATALETASLARVETCIELLYPPGSAN